MTQKFIYFFKGSSFDISLDAKPSGDHDEYFIYTNKHRPTICLSFPGKQDFHQDSKALLSIYESTGLYTDEDKTLPLIQICKKHINEWGRLIDNDLFTYIDELTLMVEAVHHLYRKRFTVQDGKELWELCRYISFEVFKDHIWVNKRAYTGFGNDELVRYSDLML